MQVSGKVFVVTGGGNGIGREVVLTLLDRGGRVAAVDLRADGLERTRALAGAGAERLTTHATDVTDPAAVAALPAAVLAAHDHVDGLLNVAGVIQPFVPFADLDRADAVRVMAVNYWGVADTVSAFLPHLRTRPEACVVNVSSMGALAPVPGQTVYGASKAAVLLLTEGLYAELRDTTVAVSVVLPGGVSTHITENSGVSLPAAGSGDAADAGNMAPTTPVDAARQIVTEGVEQGRFRVVVGKDARMLDRLARLSPKRATDTIASRMAALLAPRG